MDKLWDEVTKIVGADSPLRYVLLSVVALYFVVLATGNLRRTFLEMQGRRQHLELLKLELEVLKLRQELDSSGVAHERAKIEAEETGASLETGALFETPRTQQIPWPLWRALVFGFLGVLIALCFGWLALISIGGFLSKEYGAAFAALFIGIGGCIAGVQLVLKSYRSRQ